MFDWQVNFGNILTIGAFLVGGGSFIWTMRGQIEALGTRTEAMETELKKLVEVLINQGRQDERMNAFDQRLVAHASRVNELEKESRVNRDR